MDHLLQIVFFTGFSPHAFLTLGLVIVLLITSALISGSETAFFSLSPSDAASFREKSSRADRQIVKLLGKQDSLLASILIANNLVNICLVIVANNLLDQILVFNSAGWEFAIKVVTVTFLLLLFGEIIPKVYSAYQPLRFARFIAVPLSGLVMLLKPFSALLTRSGNRLNERLSKKKSQLSIDDLSDAIEITTDHSEEEKQILSGIVSFINTEAADIMKLRMDIVSLDITCDFAAVKKTIIDSGFSRIPVYEENLDNIKGILYVKDMLPYISQPDDFEWQAYLRTAYFVPERKKINDLLEEFQSNKVHLAIVVDEYGATQGLVSLEDILEEIVGEITDESDTEEPTFYKKIDDNTYIFEGKTHIGDFVKVIGHDEDFFGPGAQEIETLAGLLIELKHNFLSKGDSVTYEGIRFTVMSLDGRRIDKVKVQILTANAA